MKRKEGTFTAMNEPNYIKALESLLRLGGKKLGVNVKLISVTLTDGTIVQVNEA